MPQSSSSTRGGNRETANLDNATLSSKVKGKVQSSSVGKGEWESVFTPRLASRGWAMTQIGQGACGVSDDFLKMPGKVEKSTSYSRSQRV